MQTLIRPIKLSDSRRRHSSSKLMTHTVMLAVFYVALARVILHTNYEVGRAILNAVQTFSRAASYMYKMVSEWRIRAD